VKNADLQNRETTSPQDQATNPFEKFPATQSIEWSTARWASNVGVVKSPLKAGPGRSLKVTVNAVTIGPNGKDPQRKRSPSRLTRGIDNYDMTWSIDA